MSKALEKKSLVPVSSRIVVIALTAGLYAAAKGITGYIPSPWGVGQLYLYAFVPLFLAVVSETLPVAIGAALGSFIGDMIFLLPAGLTNPALALAAGVPPNFIAVLLFGYLVKKYKSWPSFITASVGAITLGNALTAGLVAVAGPYLFAPLAALTSLSAKALLTIGLSVFWDITAIPTALILVPSLVRAVKPLVGRSNVLTYYPSWSRYEVRSLLPVSIVYAAIFLGVGALFFLTPLGDSSVPDASPVKALIFVAVASLAIFGPVVGLIAGTKEIGKQIGS